MHDHGRSCPTWLIDRKPNDESRADHAAAGPAPVFGADRAAVRDNDLPRDRQAETRMGAEFFTLGAVAVEALENLLEFVVGDARPFVLDRDFHHVPVARRDQPDGAARRAERDRVDDQIAEHLAQASLEPRYDQPAGARPPEHEPPALRPARRGPPDQGWQQIAQVAPPRP